MEESEQSPAAGQDAASKRRRRSSSKRLSSSRFVWQVVAAAGAAPPPLEQIDMEHIVVFDGPTLSELEAFISKASAFLKEADTVAAGQEGSLRIARSDTATDGTAGNLIAPTDGPLGLVDVTAGSTAGASATERAVGETRAENSADPTAQHPERAISAQNNVSFDQASLQHDSSRRSGALLDGLICAASDSIHNPIVNGRLTGDNATLPYEFMIPIASKNHPVSD